MARSGRRDDARVALLECVVNVSEGRRADVIGEIGQRGGAHLLDVHTDPDHNRSVFTLAGHGTGLEDAVRALAAETVARVDLRTHTGVHPRIGVLDVVPFVPLGAATLDDAIAARDRFSAWAGEVLALPCFRYGPERSLPEVRRGAFTSLAPDAGPAEPHPSAGACAVGAREVLVAYNVWLAGSDLPFARTVAATVRGPAIRALGLQVGTGVQVSMNLVAPEDVGPARAYDLVAAQAPVERAELVGLVPASVLEAVPPHRWAELDLDEARTIEARLARAG
jgi:glutamate formiminotransferase/glutamate formiminotransferase/formiminotetrahydrofolate cyclodeaminase